MSDEPEPKPNEVWIAKSGRSVLIVCDACKPDQIGFIWHDHIDNNLTFTPLLHQLKEKSNLTVAEWGVMINELIKK